MKKTIKITLAVALLGAAALLVGVPHRRPSHLAKSFLPLELGSTAEAQPVPGYWTVPQIAVQNTATATAVTYQNQAWTNTIAASTAFTNWTRIDISQYKFFVALEIAARADAANAAAFNCGVGYNLNGSAGAGLQNPTSTNVVGALLWGPTLNGINQVVGVTNLPVATFGGLPFIYIMHLTNAGASGSVTNYTVRYYGK